MTLRVLVVDDERPARRKVVSHLGAHADTEVVGEAGDGIAAVAAIARLRPDLVFLDVQMPGADGFDVVTAVGLDVMPAVVFVTAFEEHAVRAFDVGAVDYLLKPFDARRFETAFQRARQRLGRDGAGNGDRMRRLLGAVHSGRPLERLFVSERDRAYWLTLADVTHLSAEGNYVRVHTPAAEPLLRETLAGLEARLDPRRFVRIHRSGIVALAAIAELRPSSHGDYVVVLNSGVRLRLSRRYRSRLLPSGRRL